MVEGGYTQYGGVFSGEGNGGRDSKGGRENGELTYGSVFDESNGMYVSNFLGDLVVELFQWWIVLVASEKSRIDVTTNNTYIACSFTPQKL